MVMQTGKIDVKTIEQAMLRLGSGAPKTVAKEASYGARSGAHARVRRLRWGVRLHGPASSVEIRIIISFLSESA